MPATPEPDAATPEPDAAAALPAEDAKLVTLARSSRTRAGATEGAAVRDDIGRTYTAATVELPALRLTALQAAVAAAVSSGSPDLVAVSVVGEAEELAPADAALVADLGVTTVVLAGPDGTPRAG